MGHSAACARVRRIIDIPSHASCGPPGVTDRGRACYHPAPLPLRVLQRPDWHGTPLELGDLFRLKKNRRETRAAIFTHQLGWELRLLVGAQLEVVQSQVCKDQEAVLSTGEKWKAAMVERGGHEPRSSHRP